MKNKRTSELVILCLLLALPISRADSQVRDEAPYRVVHGWPVLPENTMLNVDYDSHASYRFVEREERHL